VPVQVTLAPGWIVVLEQVIGVVFELLTLNPFATSSVVFRMEYV